jgi:3-phenylpropionate/trans-cinnamate dioxygenase ferredoxin subunit
MLIANVNENYYTIGNRCTHADGILSQGVLEGNVVTCPKHHAKFDVTTSYVKNVQRRTKKRRGF